MRIFCDFDGTTAENDVGDRFFQTFAGFEVWQRTVDRYRRGEITSRQYLEDICAASRFDAGRFEALIKEEKLDAHFPEFVRYCRSRGYPLAILSDGLDVYIRRVLENHGLADVEFFSNRMVHVDSGRIRPQLPYYGLGCGDCANCKGYHIRRGRQPGELAVFVGDGISDRCGAGAADLVLAKGELLEWCREQGMDCEPFDNFADVMRIVRGLEARLGLA